MNAHQPHHRSVITICTSFVLALASAGCHTAAPDPEAEASIAHATGVADAVTFEVEGAELDAPTAAIDVLTPQHAVARALATSPQLQIALSEVRQALAHAEQARLLPNPILDVIVRVPEGGGRPQIEAGVAADLVAALQSPRRANAADARLRASVSQAVTVALDIVAEVEESYWRAQTQDELMPLLAEREEIVVHLADIARARLEHGEGTRPDVTALATQQVELELEIADLQRQRRQERLRLTRLIGEPSGAARWRLAGWEAPPQVRTPESDWISAALRNRPEVQACLWELHALGDELALARFEPLEGGALGIDAQRDDDWGVGPSLSLPLPLFDAGQARRALIEAQRSAARHRTTQARRQVVEEVRRAYEDFVATQHSLERMRVEFVPLLLERRAQTEATYVAGQTDLASLLLAEQALRAAQARRVELERETSLSLTKLERAVGGRAIGDELARGAADTAHGAADEVQP